VPYACGRQRRSLAGAGGAQRNCDRGRPPFRHRAAERLNVLGRIKDVPEVCSIFCASANPVEVVVARTGQGCGILGVIDGDSPKGVETAVDAQIRRDFLRKIGYKR
jgi:adenosine/AMP kinase